MKLDEYLSQPGALTVAQLRERIGVKSDIQVRQWRHGYAGRQPSPEYAVAIEAATERAVRRWDLRPADWHRIWPELIGVDGAPAAASAAPAEAPPAFVDAEPRTEHAQACDQFGKTLETVARVMTGPDDDLAPTSDVAEKRHPGSEAVHVFNKQRATDRSDKPRAG